MIVSSASYHIYTTITHCSLTHSIHINTIHFSYTFLTRLITCKQCALFICEILHIPNTFKTLQGMCRKCLQISSLHLHYSTMVSKCRWNHEKASRFSKMVSLYRILFEKDSYIDWRQQVMRKEQQHCQCQRRRILKCDIDVWHIWERMMYEN